MASVLDSLADVFLRHQYTGDTHMPGRHATYMLQWWSLRTCSADVHGSGTSTVSCRDGRGQTSTNHAESQHPKCASS